MCKKESIDLRKVFFLLIEVSLARVAIYIVHCLTNGNGGISVRGFIGSIIPNNYYAILYCTLFILSPFINRLIKNLSNQSFKLLLTIALVLFSFLPTITDSVEFLTGADLGDFSTIGRQGSNWGYCLVNFILLYLIGAVLHRCYDSGKRINKKLLLVTLVLDIIILDMWGNYGLTTINNLNFSYSYCNPLVILMAVIVFTLFKDIKIKTSRIINSLASATYTVYIIHGYFLSRLGIETAVNRSILFLIGHIVVCTCGLYLLGYMLDRIYKLLWNRVVEKHILKNKITIKVA